MLTRLAVRDLAVIESAELELRPGFTVLTGETGAGKSLLVDALGLVLGDRGSASLVRAGARHAEVTAEFMAPDNESLRNALAVRELPLEEVLILHRRVGVDGRSRAWVNGVPVPLTVLRELGEPLVEIHGQHEHHALARRDAHRTLLDGWADARSQAEAVATAARAVEHTRRKLAAVAEAGKDREARSDFLKFQLRELEVLNPRENDYEELLAEYERLRFREKTGEALAVAMAALEEGETPAAGTLATARDALARLPDAAGLGETAKLLAQAETLVSEAAQQLQRLADADADPQTLDALNARIARYQGLARKHSVEPGALPRQRDRFAQELRELVASTERLQELEAVLAEQTATWGRLAQALGKQRREAAPRLADAVTRAVRELGMPQAEFTVEFEPVDANACPIGGAERVTFAVATNSGQTPGPIAQIASGGELSRLALAVEVLAGGGAGAPVLVFDEVDAGVSGRVAELVGRQLKALAEGRQVLCVTHLPQVAALADHHFSVSKSRCGEAIVTSVHPLDADRRVEAIAEMLGGIRITDSARMHAKELIGRAAS